VRGQKGPKKERRGWREKKKKKREQQKGKGGVVGHEKKIDREKKPVRVCFSGRQIRLQKKGKKGGERELGVIGGKKVIRKKKKRKKKKVKEKGITNNGLCQKEFNQTLSERGRGERGLRREGKPYQRKEKREYQRNEKKRRKTEKKGWGGEVFTNPKKRWVHIILSKNVKS